MEIYLIPFALVLANSLNIYYIIKAYFSVFNMTEVVPMIKTEST